MGIAIEFICGGEHEPPGSLSLSYFSFSAKRRIENKMVIFPLQE